VDRRRFLLAAAAVPLALREVPGALARAAGPLALVTADRQAHVAVVDLATGRKERVLELMAPDPAGVVEIVSVRLTPDAASYAYSYHRILSDLLLIEGLK